MNLTRELINVINLCLKNIDKDKLQDLVKEDLIEWDDDHYIVSEKAANDYYCYKEVIDLIIKLGEGLEE